MSEETKRFPCTFSGKIRQSKTRLTLLLTTLILGMILGSGLMFWQARTIPGVLCLLVAFGTWTALRMSGDLDPLWIDVSPDGLRIQMKRQHQEYPHAEAARRLTSEEIAYLERLITTAGFTLSTGGYESHRLGEFEMFATDLTNSLLLFYEETGVILTPDDPDGLLERLPVVPSGPTAEPASGSDTIHTP